MLRPIPKKQYAKRFSAIEANFRTEGMDPHPDPIYRAAKSAGTNRQGTN